MKDIAGYMIKRKAGLYSSRGSGYDYILAGNGLFIEAENEIMSARVQVAEVSVRGLPEMEPRLFLRNKIPMHYFDTIYRIIRNNTERELYEEQFFLITFDGKKHEEWYPPQIQTGGKVQYDISGIDFPIVLELHTHGTMQARFSGTDDQDEQGLRIYAVMGRLDRLCPEIRLRVGVYGYRQPVRFCDVFEFPDIRDSNWLRDRYVSRFDDSTAEEMIKMEAVS